MSVLQGVTVLDLSKVLAGPFCGMQLGDLGADVIKIEDPKTGDDSRGFPPFQNGVSTFYLAVNRNKKGITLDLKEQKDLDIFYKLVEKADVIIESFRTGVTEKLNIDYSTLKKINPKIIYCSISGFGRKGPRAKQGGYDLLAQAFGGLMSITGNDENEAPVRAGYSISDITTGINATVAIFSALYRREKTNQGSYVETSLLQSQVSLMSYYATMFHHNQTIPKPRGSGHPNFAPYQALKGKNGYVVIGVSNDRQWQSLCTLDIFQHLSIDTRFHKNRDRIENINDLIEELENITVHYEKDELISLFEKVNIPASPINNVKEVIEDPQVDFYNMLIKMNHDEAGEFLSASTPFQFADLDIDYKLSPPSKGEHNKEIFKELRSEG